MIARYSTFLLPNVLRAVIGMFLIVPLTTWYLNPADFGLFAIITSLTAIIPAVSSVGAAWVLGGNFFKQDEQAHSDIILALILCGAALACVWALLFISGLGLAIHYVIGEATWRAESCLLLSIATVVLNALWPIASSYLILRRQATQHAIVEVATFLASAAGVVICLTLMNLSVTALFVGPLLGSIVSAGASLWILRGHISRGRFNWIHFREVLRVGLPSNAVTVCETLQAAGLKFFMRSMEGLASLGLFAHSESYRGVLVTFTKAFNMVYGPEVLRALSGETSVTSLKRIAWSFGVVLSCGGIVTSLFSVEIIRLLTHDKFTGAAPFVVVWYLLAISHAYGNGFTQYLVLKKCSRFLAWSVALPTLLWLGIGFVLIHSLGTAGAAIAILLSSLTVQLARRQKALDINGPRIEERPFVIAWVMTLAGFIACFGFQLGFKWKLITAVLLSCVLAAMYLLQRRKDERHQTNLECVRSI